MPKGSGTNSQGNHYNTPGGTNSSSGSSYHCKYIVLSNSDRLKFCMVFFVERLVCQPRTSEPTREMARENLPKSCYPFLPATFWNRFQHERELLLQERQRKHLLQQRKRRNSLHSSRKVNRLEESFGSFVYSVGLVAGIQRIQRDISIHKIVEIRPERCNGAL